MGLKCTTVGIPHCSPKPKQFAGLKKCVPVYQDFAMRDCEEVKEAVKHKKKLPECKQVTKNNCLTDWDVDANGNKVWAGTEKCTPVTWEECSIVEKEVDFPTVRSCATVEYDDCKMEANNDCRDVTIHEPTQPKKHLKKCLT